MGRLFTDEELKIMATPTKDRAKDAIDKGNYEEAKQLIDTMYEQLAFLHDGATAWLAGLQTFIYENYGPEVLAKAEEKAHTLEVKVALKPVGEPPAPDDVKGQVMQRVFGLHGHVYQPMTIEEDEEKITITVDPCGSGGRLIEWGSYDPEVGFACVKEAGPLTYGLEGMPIYCVHCPATDMLCLEGMGTFACIQPREQDTVMSPRCAHVIYKDPAKVPEHYYTRLGFKKPEVFDGSPAERLEGQ